MSPDVDHGVARPGAIAWRWLLVISAAHVIAHLITNGNYGMFRDEYYYLACADRLDWGYVDHPPLSILILACWKSIFGDTAQSIRVLPALAGGGLVVLTGGLAAELGGGRFAQVLGALAAAVGIVATVLTGFYSMNAFDLVIWAAAFWMLARLLRESRPGIWYWLGLMLGLGLQNKVGLLVFGLSLALAVVATRERRWLAQRQIWIGGALALAIFFPYVIWNLAHDGATLEFIANAKREKISDLGVLPFLAENVLEANPFNLPLWLGGLGWLLLARRARAFRLLGLSFVFTLAILIAQKSKPYYLAPAFSILMAAGGCAWEEWTASGRLRWLRVAMPVVMIVGFLVLAPIVYPILPIDGVLRYQQRLGIVPATGEETPSDQAPQYFSDRFGWEEQARKVAEVYAGLSPRDRKGLVVVAGNYGEAGALEYYGRSLELPPVVSGHNNYAFWWNDIEVGDVALAIGFGRESLEEAFVDVQRGAVAVSPFARESERTVWICRGRKLSSEEIRRLLRHYI